MLHRGGVSEHNLSWFIKKNKKTTVEHRLGKGNRLLWAPIHMVSMALCGEMEPDAHCEEPKEPIVELTEPEVREATCKLADVDSRTVMPCGPAEESQALCGKNTAEAESCAGGNESTGIKSSSDPERESGKAECNGQRKLKKTNSWKMVRFQDPSMEDDVLERDSSAESLFPEYASEEWTFSSFAELFTKVDWQDVTGENGLFLVSDTVGWRVQISF